MFSVSIVVAKSTLCSRQPLKTKHIINYLPPFDFDCVSVTNLSLLSSSLWSCEVVDWLWLWCVHSMWLHGWQTWELSLSLEKSKRTKKCWFPWHEWASHTSCRSTTLIIAIVSILVGFNSTMMSRFPLFNFHHLKEAGWPHSAADSINRHLLELSNPRLSNLLHLLSCPFSYN